MCDHDISPRYSPTALGSMRNFQQRGEWTNCCTKHEACQLHPFPENDAIKYRQLSHEPPWERGVYNSLVELRLVLV